MHLTGQEPVLASETTPVGVVRALKPKDNDVITRRVGGDANVALLDPRKGALAAATDAGPESALLIGTRTFR